MSIETVNLVVSDLERSAAFYRALGWELRAISMPDRDAPLAWMTMSGPAPGTLHSADFATWWDPTAPAPQPGTVTIDISVDDADALDEWVRRASEAGAHVLAEPRDMPWGQRYTIVTDPDGYRWGVKADLPDDLLPGEDGEDVEDTGPAENAENVESAES